MILAGLISEKLMTSEKLDELLFERTLDHDAGISNGHNSYGLLKTKMVRFGNMCKLKFLVQQFNNLYLLSNKYVEHLLKILPSTSQTDLLSYKV